jgi:hypothetical protein
MEELSVVLTLPDVEREKRQGCASCPSYPDQSALHPRCFSPFFPPQNRIAMPRVSAWLSECVPMALSFWTQSSDSSDCGSLRVTNP